MKYDNDPSSHVGAANMSKHMCCVSLEADSVGKIDLVNKLLGGVHTAAAAEAMALAAKAGLNTREVYDIIAGGAAGNSWAFTNRVPSMIGMGKECYSSIQTITKDMGMVTATARALQFPLPIASAAEQLYIYASSQGHGEKDGAEILRTFIPEASDTAKDLAQDLKHDGKPSKNVDLKQISEIGFIGLGAMGYGMATSLIRAGYFVTAYDVYLPSVDKFVVAGNHAKGALSATEVMTGADLVILMVQSAAQVDDVLFGGENAINAVHNGTTIMLSCTVPPSYARDLAARLLALDRGITLVDAPVSGGVARAAKGDLTFICSGDEPVIESLKRPLLAMAGTTNNVCRVRGGVGAASSVKMINQLLAGVHITAAAEAMAFASSLGLEPKAVFEAFKGTAAWSWMFENRVPQILASDWTPFSALSIFVKDMGIVVNEAKRLLSFAPISSVAYTLYLTGAAKGLSKEADIGVFRLWPPTNTSAEIN